MVACHSFSSTAVVVVEVLLTPFGTDSGGGGDSSRSRAEPHSRVAQTGASRSGAGGDRARREARLLDLSRLGCESWYLSGKRLDGRVR